MAEVPSSVATACPVVVFRYDVNLFKFNNGPRQDPPMAAATQASIGSTPLTAASLVSGSVFMISRLWVVGFGDELELGVMRIKGFCSWKSILPSVIVTLLKSYSLLVVKRTQPFWNTQHVNNSEIDTWCVEEDGDGSILTRLRGKLWFGIDDLIGVEGAEEVEVAAPRDLMMVSLRTSRAVFGLFWVLNNELTGVGNFVKGEHDWEGFILTWQHLSNQYYWWQLLQKARTFLKQNKFIWKNGPAF